jgi:hypothetical protein
MAAPDDEKQRRRDERIAMQERAAAGATRRLRIGIVAGVVATLACVGVVVALVAGGGGDAAPGSAGSTQPAAASGLAGVQDAPPPWTAGNEDGLEARLRTLGLPALTAEGQVLHIHQHLDVLVDGDPVEVPAGIGIDANQQFISELHTHDATGIMHVEAPKRDAFTLGQFFSVWGVPLSASQLGGLRTGDGKQLRVWVNGNAVSGDPAKVVLASHQEIVVAYGAPSSMPKDPPSSFAFPAGL